MTRETSNDEKLSKAKSKLVMYHPFFASLICSMPMIEDDTLNPPTMATNGRWVRYHPEFVEKGTVDEMLFVLCHEIGHCMFAHMFRRGHRHPLIWNLAGDYIINDLLVSDNIGVPPQGVLIDANLVQQGGGTTDGVYDIIMQKVSKQKGGGPSDGDRTGAFDWCDDSPGDAASRAQAEAEMKVGIAQAAAAAKMCGKLGEKLARLVDMAMKPQVAWQDVLRRFISQKAKVDYTYARPKRRFLSEDLYLPSLGGERLGEIAIAVDCSGSIGQDELNEFAAELRSIKEDCKPTKMHIIYFHHVVCKHDTFTHDEDLVVEPAGSGGTAFSPIFKFISDEDLEPVATVVLTDLCCGDFGPPPSYPVLWVSTAMDSAPWGEIIMMKSAL